MADGCPSSIALLLSPYAISHSHKPSSSHLAPRTSHLASLARRCILVAVRQSCRTHSFALSHRTERKSHEACCLHWWEPAALLTAAAGIGPSTFVGRSPRRRKPRRRRSMVEPLWPKPFPQKKAWILGSVTGVTVDGAGSHLGRAPRRRLAADQRKRAGARAVGELVLLRGAADPRVRHRRHAARTAGIRRTGSGYDWPHDPPASPSDKAATCRSPAACRRTSLAPARGRGPAPAAPGAAGRGGRRPQARTRRGSGRTSGGRTRC